MCLFSAFVALQLLFFVLEESESQSVVSVSFSLFVFGCVKSDVLI